MNLKIKAQTKNNDDDVEKNKMIRVDVATATATNTNINTTTTIITTAATATAAATPPTTISTNNLNVETIEIASLPAAAAINSSASTCNNNNNTNNNTINKKQQHRRPSLNENYRNNNNHRYNNNSSSSSIITNSCCGTNNNNNNNNVQIFTNTKELNQVNLNSSSPTTTTTTPTNTITQAQAQREAISPSSSQTKRTSTTTTTTTTKTASANEKQLITFVTMRKSHSTPVLSSSSSIDEHHNYNNNYNNNNNNSTSVSRNHHQQQHIDSSSNSNNNSNGKVTVIETTALPASAAAESLRFGCAHYKRRAMFVTPCCNKFYKCRFCHDENESHHFDRKTLTELICSECHTRQKVQEKCQNCFVRFGKYTCLICNLFDDADKQQYHCHGCGICRIGGADNFFHCEVCNMCLPIQLKIDGHRCVENISRSHCPVCLGDIHTSRIPCHIPDCGHLLHKMCFDQLLASGHYTCPTCQTSLIDMTALWEYLDAQALRMPIPIKYENQRVHIFCNDCHKTSKTKFHFIGLKCVYCGAYNTTQDVKRRMSLVTDEPSSA